MGDVPVLVLGCIHAPGGLPEGNQAGSWGSLLPAAWSYMLAARARGLGTAWTSLHLAYESEIAELLGIPADVRQGVLIPTAYHTGEPPTTRVRRSGPGTGSRWSRCFTSTAGRSTAGRSTVEGTPYVKESP
ncbi:nitroreductase family protein [Nonomuraea diastatica]|uniref:nitroreductase family protein n=1 Tax=Nonomuraea diastatica TaxID=1848329 RepID=UPI001FE74818|nr:nitroreductase family protein [Nonomuraea diastatica]